MLSESQWQTSTKQLLEAAIMKPRHDNQLPTIRRLWLEYLAEENRGFWAKVKAWLGINQ